MSNNPAIYGFGIQESASAHKINDKIHCQELNTESKKLE